jgi:hypothetical protein
MKPEIRRQNTALSGFGHDLALKCLANGMPVFAGCLTEQAKFEK